MTAQLSRREFLGYALTGGALVVSVPLSFAQTSSIVMAPAKLNEDEMKLTPLVKIQPNNEITFYYPSPEMGQGVDTSLAMIFIEELGGDMDLVTVEPMPYLIERDEKGEIKPVAVPQFAGGSTSISRNFELLRQAGALVRQLLLQAASRQHGKDFDELSTDKSFVTTQTDFKIAFGDLIRHAAKEVIPAGFTPILKSAEQWQIIGDKLPSTQAREIVTGQPLYGMDMDYPGAKVAMVARCPFLDGYPESVETRKALKMPGVHAVVNLHRPDLDKYYTYLAAGVAVVADDFWTAKTALDKLVIRWNKGPHANESTTSLNQQCEELLKTRGQIVRDDGDYAGALETADKVISRNYRLPLVSHAQLEPQNCIAHVTKDKCTVIGPMQSPGGASRQAAKITGFDRVDIDVRYTRLGGGFGRRLSSDHVAEAVTIAKQSGLPIKLIWTREDDMAHDFYRPMGHHQMTAAADENGQIVAWSHRLAGTPKYYRRDGVKPEELFGADMYIDDFPAGLVQNLQYEYFAAKSGTPQGSWRAPAHTANAFVVQSFLDELAEELEQDPLELRLAMLGDAKELAYEQHGGPVFDTGRMAGVLKQAAKMAGWGKKMPAGRALGLAGHFTFGGYCAQVADVELLANSKFKVHKVFSAIDVGIVVNREGVTAQVEGGINDGLSTALGQQVLVQSGRVTTENFDTYPMMRIADSVPEIDVHIVKNDKPPSGVGEMGLPPLAPALSNAIKAAGGDRLRALPIYGNSNNA